MQATTSVFVKYAVVAMLAAGSGFVQAQPVPTTNCRISNQPGVIAGYGNAPSLHDDVYTLDYDGNQLVYKANSQNETCSKTGSSPIVGNQDANVLQLPGFGLTFSKLNGNPGFNHGVFSNKWGTACGTLVDNSKPKDDLADEIVVQLGAYAGRGTVPTMLISFPINEITNDIYWLLAIDSDWTSSPCPLNFFTPVNTGVTPPEIRLECDSSVITGGTGNQQTDANGTLDVVVTQETNATAPGPCATNAIPTATFWGYAAMTLLLMFAGMRLLRKGGFGDDFNLRA